MQIDAKRLESDEICILKILKFLLKIFENVDINKTYLDGFINRLHERVLGEIESVSEESTFVHHHIIGACITPYTIRCLLQRDFNTFSHTILAFVRYSENIKEIMDLFDEYLIITESYEGDTRSCHDENENRRYDRKHLLSLLEVRDSDGDNFISYALLNINGEIAASVLKLFRNSLGKQSFIKEVIESDTYIKTMEHCIIIHDTNQILKKLQCLADFFKEEIELLLNESLKDKIIGKYLISKNNKLSFLSEEEFKILQQCLGNHCTLFGFVANKNRRNL